MLGEYVLHTSLRYCGELGVGRVLWSGTEFGKVLELNGVSRMYETKWIVAEAP